MGGLLSFFWRDATDANDEEIDPATGLSGKQKRLVTETWSIVRKDPLPTGVAIMMTFLRKHPEYRKEFNAFDDSSLESLPKNKRFQAHVTSVVNGISAIIDSLNDPGLLGANLLSLGEKHHRRGQTKEQFINLKIVLLQVLCEVLEIKYTPEVAEAWNSTLDVAFSIVFESFAL